MKIIDKPDILDWLVAFAILFSMLLAFSGYVRMPEELPQEEFDEILQEDIALLCSEEGQLIARDMGLTWDQNALDYLCAMPRRPAMAMPEISAAALESWYSHDTRNICNSPGYLEALKQGNHSYTDEQITWLCNRPGRVGLQ